MQAMQGWDPSPSRSQPMIKPWHSSPYKAVDWAEPWLSHDCWAGTVIERSVDWACFLKAPGTQAQT